MVFILFIAHSRQLISNLSIPRQRRMAMLTSNHTGSIHKIPTHTHTHTRTRTRRLLHDQSAGMRNNGTPASTSTSTSSSSSSSTSIQQSAKEIEALFQLDTSISIKLAKELSPSARNELSQARKNLIQSESSISKGAGAITEAEPSKRDLRIHALTQGIPFIGFGIMDNAILIWAGDQIDTHLGVVFGISTLCAAAIGNIISDVAGVGLGAYIEDFCARRLSLPRINLSNAQRNLRSVRWAGQRGICVGLTIGCIIGMFPLLFIDTEEVQMHKKNNKIFGIFRDVMMEAKGLVSAESTCLFLIVADENSTIPAHYNRKQEKSIYIKRFLFCRGYFDDTDTGTKDLRMPVGRGLVSKATIEGSILNVKE
jgi:hypothetical protein